VPEHNRNRTYRTDTKAMDVHALLAANEHLKVQAAAQEEALKRAEAENKRAIQTALALQQTHREAEEQLRTLRTGFISLDEKHAELEEQSLARQNHLQNCLLQSLAKNAKLAQHAKKLESKCPKSSCMGLQEDKDDVSTVSCGTTTSRADSAVEEVGRTLKLLFAESNPPMNLEAQALWAENKRLKAECEKAQRSKAKLGSQLHAISQSARDKEAELGASAAVAQEFAAAQKRLEVDLIRAREEKKLMEQALVRLPLEAQRRHEEEADRLRAELEASRRNERSLQQAAQDRSQQMDQQYLKDSGAHGICTMQRERESASHAHISAAQALPYCDRYAWPRQRELNRTWQLSPDQDSEFTSREASYLPLNRLSEAHEQHSPGYPLPAGSGYSGTSPQSVGQYFNTALPMPPVVTSATSLSPAHPAQSPPLVKDLDVAQDVGLVEQLLRALRQEREHSKRTERQLEKMTHQSLESAATSATMQRVRDTAEDNSRHESKRHSSRKKEQASSRRKSDVRKSLSSTLPAVSASSDYTESEEKEEEDSSVESGVDKGCHASSEPDTKNILTQENEANRREQQQNCGASLSTREQDQEPDQERESRETRRKKESGRQAERTRQICTLKDESGRNKRVNDEAGASLSAGSTFQEDSSSHGKHCESASEERGGGGGGGGVIANEQLQQVSERLKQVLDAEMRSRGLSGFDLVFQCVSLLLLLSHHTYRLASSPLVSMHCLPVIFVQHDLLSAPSRAFTHSPPP
jgi:hypothetical protein